MKLERRRPWRKAARLAVAALVIGGTGSGFGCLDRPIAENKPRTTTTIVEKLTTSAVDKIDILLAIDNSGSMADKQDILITAVPDLVKGLVNPRCVDPTGVQKPMTPATSEDECLPGMIREFKPVVDIHIGIISSSLGGHGARTSCTKEDGISNVDMSHLLARRVDTSATNDIPTYQGKGFLAWDPTQKLDGKIGTPDANDGEADIENPDTDKDLNDTTLVGSLTEMVKGVGQSGCGFEAQLESVYRFLVDPVPYKTISVLRDMNGDRIVVDGVDDTVLTQRADFLRPNSLLAIIMLTDENDCSLREEGQAYLAAERRTTNNAVFHLWRPRKECATDPNDPCCKSCRVNPGECPRDDTCFLSDGTTAAPLTEVEDQINLRCFDQKRRFGFDFLYPVDRYTKAFTDVQIQDRAGNLVPNPIFSDLNPKDKEVNIRDSGLVFFAGIVGVPWQNLARQTAEGQPDLVNGLDPQGKPVGGFKSSDELLLPTHGAASAWDIILGDPANYVRAIDPHMHEQVGERTGTNPITGTAISPASSTDPEADVISGHEWTIEEQDDLQYACIFPLPQARPCANRDNCGDCTHADRTHNPLCLDDGQNVSQVKAKAYPGIRELQVVKGLGSQGIVGSVCPEQLDDMRKGDANYGYRPAIGAIIDRLKSVLGGQCLPRTLTPDDKGQVSCLILEARNSQGECNCNTDARQDVTEGHKAAKEAALADPIAKQAAWDCVCEIKQVEDKERSASDPVDDKTVDSALRACQLTVPPDPAQYTDAAGQLVDANGWCYIDATSNPPIGDPDIVASCPKTERRLVRFVGKGEAQLGATLFITCSGE